MKQIFLFSALALTFAACGNSNKTEDKATTSEATASETAATAAAAPTNGPKDPVCEMDKKADWDQYTVYGGDTTWFCSPHCKETFDKDPAKFAKK
ncbi:YHS domain protein [compost metagenome]